MKILTAARCATPATSRLVASLTLTASSSTTWTSFLRTTAICTTVRGRVARDTCQWRWTPFITCKFNKLQSIFWAFSKLLFSSYLVYLTMTFLVASAPWRESNLKPSTAFQITSGVGAAKMMICKTFSWVKLVEPTSLNITSSQTTQIFPRQIPQLPSQSVQCDHCPLHNASPQKDGKHVQVSPNKRWLLLLLLHLSFLQHQ